MLSLIALVIILFVVFGLLGWILKLIGAIFAFLFDGCCQSISVIIVIVLIIVALLVVV